MTTLVDWMVKGTRKVLGTDTSVGDSHTGVLFTYLGNYYTLCLRYMVGTTSSSYFIIHRDRRQKDDWK